VYLGVGGALLLAQGVVSLLFLSAGAGAADATHGVLSRDALHAMIHVVWGAILLWALRRLRGRQLVVLGVTFGVFYSLLAVLGMLVQHPFGLHLAAGEHTFHIVVGVSSLLVSAQARANLRQRATLAGAATHSSLSTD
jgi:hypothetical protein